MNPMKIEYSGSDVTNNILTLLTQRSVNNFHINGAPISLFCCLLMRIILLLLQLGAGEERVPGFVGDFMLGQRYADETVFQRIIEFENPTNAIQSTTFKLSVSNGKLYYYYTNIHFLLLTNNIDSKFTEPAIFM